MNTDQTSMVPAWHTVQTAYAAVSGMQDAPPAQRVMGVFLLFSELCTELSIDPSQALDAARRLTRHAEDHCSVELSALRNYIRGEIRNG